MLGPIAPVRVAFGIVDLESGNVRRVYSTLSRAIRVVAVLNDVAGRTSFVVAVKQQ
jgi:hypothetical protein